MFKSKVTSKYKIVSDYQKWKGRWVHYTDFPMLKIRPSSYHRDPAGIYLFPSKFETMGIWYTNKHKFIVEIKPEAKILDFATIKTPEDAKDLINKLDIVDKDLPSFQSEHSTPVDLMWDYLTERFMHKSGDFNKRFRHLGYDAIFDDTGSIHSAEVQLLVLNPKIIKVIERVDRGGTGFKEIDDARKVIVEELKKYTGKIRENKPKKDMSWGTKLVKSTVRIEDEPKEKTYTNHEGKEEKFTAYDKECSFELKADNIHKKGEPATDMSIYATGVTPGKPPVGDYHDEYRNNLGMKLVDFSPEKVKEFVHKVMEDLKW